VTLIKIHPGIDPRIIDWYVDQNYKGIILEGTGLGHTSEYCFPAIQRAIDNDIVVGMTSQCIWGRVNMNVYEAGLDLMKIGVLPLEDMLPETALVKLAKGLC
jgi:glutamyl-tRNA(Gln) amidotransferase subunit D